jgi:hypothetical protein
MMDEFMHWPKPRFLLSATCDEILSWMIGFWVEYHFVSNNICNTVNLQSLQKNYKEMTINVGLIVSDGDTIPRFTIYFEQDN